MPHHNQYLLFWLGFTLCASNRPEIFRRIHFNMTNVNKENVHAVYMNSSIICGAMAYDNFDLVSTYCIGVTGGCLLIKETFNAYYDDGTPENVYRCYTNQEPLIDYTTAKAACGPGPCCPPPFETKSDIGCVLLHLEELHWGVAVQHCQAFWPTSHIYMEPPSDGVRAFLQEKGNQAAWVGAHFIGNGKWEYVNKEEVHGSSWSPLEPHQLNVWLLGPPGPWDCVVQTPDLRFKDYPCLAKVRSICKIET